jgi:membrane protein DedA with SNARE-associated domain
MALNLTNTTSNVLSKTNVIPNIFSYFSMFVTTHPFLISFLSGALSEELVVFLAILSGRHILPLWIVFVFGPMGALFFNSLCFFSGKSKFGKGLNDYLSRNKKHIPGEEDLEHINKKRHIFYLTASKFVWGTRTASAVYYGMKGMDFKKFLLYDGIAIYIWALVMVPAGWLAGNGFNYLLRLTRGLERFLAIVLISVVVIFIIYKLIRVIIIKEYKVIEK